MLVLGVESSCDDTAAAVVRDGHEVLSNVVSSQDDIHSLYGGIVPELASRMHIESIIPVIEEALKRAGVTMDNIDGVAVTEGPGLVGSILIGLNFVKSYTYILDKPYVGVNHINAHPLAVFLHESKKEEALTKIPEFPFVALVVSGGHTSLMLMRGYTDFTVLGQTRDDAAGEAFDKVAKLLGLGYPGGAVIDRLAKEGNAGAINFPRPLINKKNLEFSFSGLKTAVLHEVRRHVAKGESASDVLGEELVRDIAASFQEAAVDVLVEKSLLAVMESDAEGLIISGGVACNSRLREKLSDRAEAEGVPLFLPSPKYCSDNGAMIAALGYHHLNSGKRADLTLNAYPNWDEGS
jgi:N6-L-threonylcarbamoyladenine synthase